MQKDHTRPNFLKLHTYVSFEDANDSLDILKWRQSTKFTGLPLHYQSVLPTEAYMRSPPPICDGLYCRSILLAQPCLYCASQQETCLHKVHPSIPSKTAHVLRPLDKKKGISQVHLKGGLLHSPLAQETNALCWGVRINNERISQYEQVDGVSKAPSSDRGHHKTNEELHECRRATCCSRREKFFS